LQDIFLFNATIKENIAFGVEQASDEQIVAAARAARLHDFILTLADGYDTYVGERGVTLSGGQKQRVAIARTLLLDPRILLLDDATSSVDMETEYLIQQALEVVMQGRTTFVVASRLRTIKNADLILVLEHGSIVERGTHEELLTHNGPYARLYDLQLREQEEFEEQSLHNWQQEQDGESGAAPASPGGDRPNKGGAGQLGVGTGFSPSVGEAASMPPASSSTDDNYSPSSVGTHLSASTPARREARRS